MYDIVFDFDPIHNSTYCYRNRKDMRLFNIKNNKQKVEEQRA